MSFINQALDFISQDETLGGNIRTTAQFPERWNENEQPTGLLFSVLEQRQFSLTRDRSGVFGGSLGQEYKANFLLPAVDIADEGSHQYSNENLGALAEIASGSDDFVGATLASLQRTIQQTSGGEELAAARGQSADTRTVNIYTGTSTRTKEFSWTMLPESRKDVQEIVEIMRLIKTWSAPSIKDRVVRVPPTWTVEEVAVDPEIESTRELPLYRFGPANISNYSFNMSPDKLWKLFHTGDPIQFELSISLDEMYVNSREDIERYGL